MKIGQRFETTPRWDSMVTGATVYVSPSIVDDLRAQLSVASGPVSDDATVSIWIGKDGRTVRYVGTKMVVDPTLEDGTIRMPDGRVFPWGKTALK